MHKMRKVVFSFAALCLLLVQLPISGQTPQPTSQKITKLTRGSDSAVMAKAFRDGKLPEPAPLPRENVDQQAATLAKAVITRDDSSTAALHAAILAAGYGVRDSDGSVMQTREQGQGLILDSWEIAAAAKLYGEDYGITLWHLSEAFVRNVPEFKNASLATALLEGIRAGANSNQLSVRFWSRFIVELGRNSKPATDLLGETDPTRIRLDAIQVALILSRLAGDFAALERRTAARHHSLPTVQSPCPTDETDDLILDYGAAASTSLFDILTKRLGPRMQSIGGKVGIANIVATVFTFVTTYALLNVEISMDADMLVRTYNLKEGNRQTLTAKLKIDKGSWEKLKCIRPLLNLAGLDLEFPEAGPLSGVTAAWSIVRGNEEEDHIIYLKPKDGSHPFPNKQQTDSNGVSVIDVIGMPQKEDLTNRKRLELYKPAGVTIGVQIKPMRIRDTQAALSTLGDITENVLSFLTGDAVGGGVGVVFETMYRSNWYSAKPFYFMVKDWEPCNGQWQGTMTYNTSLIEKGSAESNVNISSWNDEEHYDSEIVISGKKDNLGAPWARVKATATLRRERTSTGKGVCYRTSTQIQELSGNETAVTTGFGVYVDPRTKQYRVSPPALVVNASGTYSVVSEVKGTCNNPYNKNLRQNNPEKDMKLSPEGPIVMGLGVIDPKNPDEISGEDTVTVPTNRGGERKVYVKWNLKRCRE